jgi:hypothetical protein
LLRVVSFASSTGGGFDHSLCLVDLDDAPVPVEAPLQLAAALKA